MADIARAYNLIIDACNDPHVGYSQSKRRTITLGVSYNTYCDCSSLISWALTGSGFYSNNPWFSTHNEVSQLLGCGFHEEPVDGEWKKGDVLWRVGHTEMVYDDRVTMGAHTDGIPFAKQVSINEFSSKPSEWTRCFRYKNGVEEDEPKLDVSIYVICAIVGNWSKESNVNPGIWESLINNGPAGPGGYGLGQWTNHNGTTRKEQLFAWLRSNGYSDDDGDAQCKYFYEENFWQAATSRPLSFATLHEFLTSKSTDIPALTETFMRAWEIPGVPALADRIAFAQKAYDYILAHKDEKPAWITGNRYLGEADQLNNALACYHALHFDENPDGGEGWSNLLRWGIAREIYRRRLIWR